MDSWFWSPEFSFTSWVATWRASEVSWWGLWLAFLAFLLTSALKGFRGEPIGLSLVEAVGVGLLTFVAVFFGVTALVILVLEPLAWWVLLGVSGVALLGFVAYMVGWLWREPPYV